MDAKGENLFWLHSIKLAVSQYALAPELLQMSVRV